MEITVGQWIAIAHRWAFDRSLTLERATQTNSKHTVGTDANRRNTETKHEISILLRVVGEASDKKRDWTCSSTGIIIIEQVQIEVSKKEEFKKQQRLKKGRYEYYIFPNGISKQENPHIPHRFFYLKGATTNSMANMQTAILFCSVAKIVELNSATWDS